MNYPCTVFNEQFYRTQASKDNLIFLLRTIHCYLDYVIQSKIQNSQSVVSVISAEGRKNHVESKY